MKLFDNNWSFIFFLVLISIMIFFELSNTTYVIIGIFSALLLMIRIIYFLKLFFKK